jgi:hypothetical protein
VIFEVVVLALASMVRPTSLAAIYALLGNDSRRSFLVAYVFAGLAFTVVFGLVVVYAFHGIHVHTGHAKGVVDLVGGVLIVCFGFAVLTHRVARPRSTRGTFDERLTLRTAALAGPATHLPGLFYLVALNVIVAHNPRVAGGTAAVLIYNAIWFALPLLALALCIVRPEAARSAIGAVEEWAARHARTILLVASFVAGPALIVRGALSL